MEHRMTSHKKLLIILATAGLTVIACAIAAYVIAVHIIMKSIH